MSRLRARGHRDRGLALPGHRRDRAPAGRSGLGAARAIPLDCTDGFGEAYYGRPEALLDPGARRANSAWSFIASDVEPRFERELRADLDAGRWDASHSALRTQPEFEGSLRLIVAQI